MAESYIVTSPSGQRYRLTRPATGESLLEEPSQPESGNILSKILSPFQAERRVLGEKVGRDVQVGKDLFGATALGAIARAGTAPPFRMVAEHLTSPETVGRVVEEGTNPLNVLMGLQGPRVASAAGRAATQSVATLGQGARQVAKIPGAVSEAVTLGRPSTILQPNRARDLAFSRIRQRLLQAPRVASKTFEAGLDDLVRSNLGKFIDVTPEVELTKTYLSNPHFAQVLETSLRQAPMSEVQRGLVRTIFETPPTNLSLDQAQLVKRVFQQGLKQKWSQINPDFLGAHLDMQELYHAIRGKELAAFPGFEEVAKRYASTLQGFRTIKNALKEGNFEEAILSNFKNKGLLIDQFRELASPNTLQMVQRLQKATSLRKGLKFLGLTAAGGAATVVGAGAVGKPLLKFLTGRN